MGICCCPNHQAITYSVARVVITSTAITREEENCAVMSTRNLWSLSTFLGKSRCFEGAQRAFLSAQSKYIFDLVSPKANGFRPAGSRSVSLQVVAQRMKSVGNIQKITAAMKMVAASRLKGAQMKMEKSRGLVQPLSRLLGDVPGESCRFFFYLRAQHLKLRCCRFHFGHNNTYSDIF